MQQYTTEPQQQVMQDSKTQKNKNCQSLVLCSLHVLCLPCFVATMAIDTVLQCITCSFREFNPNVGKYPSDQHLCCYRNKTQTYDECCDFWYNPCYCTYFFHYEIYDCVNNCTK